MHELAGKLLAIAKKYKLEDSKFEGQTDIGLKDVLESKDLSKLVPIAISEIVKEAAEPTLLANQLFTRIQQKEGIYIQLPAVGAMDGVEEIAPGQEYGTEELTMGGGSTIRVDIRKYGLKLSLTEEMIDQSQWDVIGEWLKAAGKAFARKKNRICFNLFETQAMTLVDNKNPGRSVLGRPLSGIGSDMSNNYSFTAEDFFDIYAAMLQEGFAPSVIVMHPLTWGMWVKDPILRFYAWQNGSGTFFNQFSLGGVKRDSFFENRGMSSGGANIGETNPVDFKGAPILPVGLNVPFRIMVSNQVPFNPVTKMTSMYFIDPENCGALVEAEAINHHQWADPERDIAVIKLREKYGIAMLNEGKGVGVVKNVPVNAINRVANFGITNVNATAGDLKFPEDGIAPMA